jgi:hypothetical protein
MADEHRTWRRQDEGFWRAHHEAWKRSDLNQRQYCEAEGIPLKAFGNWRAQFKAEPQPSERKLLYRRRPLSPPLSPPISPLLSPVTSMTTSCSSALRNSAPISRGPKPHCRQWRSSHPGSDRRPTAQACRRICRAKRCGSTLSIRPAPAAVARCMRSARLSARCSIMCRRGFGSSASAGRAMAAVPAGPFIRRPPRSARSPRASPVLAFWLTSSYQSTATTSRFTGRAKSSPGKAPS